MGRLRLYREAIMFIKCKVSVEANKLTIKKKRKEKKQGPVKKEKNKLLHNKKYIL